VLGPIAILIILTAWLGHAFGLTILLNIVYSYPVHRLILRVIRTLVAAIVFAFPVAAYWSLCEANTWHDVSVPVLIYIGMCLTVSLIILPGLTLYRNVRRRPSVVNHQLSHVVDIAAELGYRPLGFGKHWRWARLPFNQLLEVDFVDRTLRLPRLPAAWEGLTILHLSDLHFHGSPERPFFQRLIEHINEHGIPDLVCITGDIVDTAWHQHWIKPLLGQLKWREAGLAILGNHDLWYRPDSVRRQLRRAGFTVLSDGPVELMVRGKPMLAIGHEGPWFPSPPPPQRGGQGGGDSPFQLLLSHTPDNIAWARQLQVDLMLSGHVHGGQVRFPIVGSVFVPSRYSRKYDQGVFFEPPTVLSVSRGISGREPLRINCRPEVTWIILRCGDQLTNR
jgi:predicted MPP superfamily phosphohydrolase